MEITELPNGEYVVEYNGSAIAQFERKAQAKRFVEVREENKENPLSELLRSR